MTRFEMSHHGPLTDWEREAIAERPPRKPPVWTEIAARNLARHSPLLHRDGITTHLREGTTTVLVTRGNLGVLMVATDDGWRSHPYRSDLRLPLDSTVILERRLHRLLTATP